MGNGQRMLIILLLFIFSCTELKKEETVVLKKTTGQSEKVDSNKVSIVFHDSMNVDVIFIDRKIRELKHDSNNVVLDIELNKGEYKLLVQKKNKSFVKSLINVDPGNIYAASYGVKKEIIEKGKNEPVKKEKENTFWDIISSIAGIIFAVVLILLYVIVPLINYLSQNKDLAILIVVAVVGIGGLGLLYVAFRIIYTDWSPFVSLYFIFIPGLYALIIGALGAADEGYKKDTSHEWRFITSGNTTGGRYKDATVKDVYEHYHRGGSWEKKIKNRKISFFIFGIVFAFIGASIINNNSHINLFFHSLGFLVVVILGSINYIIVCLLFYDKKGSINKILFFISLFNVLGCVLTIYLK